MKNLPLTTPGSPDILLIGHACHDKTSNGFTLGGAVSYAGRFARGIGLKTAMLTSYGDDFLFSDHFQSIDCQVVPSRETTIFENIYHNGERTQFLHAKATDLAPEHLPEAWKKAKIVLLCPIADEVSPGFLDGFDNTFICVCPQGWMRLRGEGNRILPKQLSFWNRLLETNLICMSEHDVARDWDFINQLGKKAKLLAVTQGEEGATLFEMGEKSFFPAFPVVEKNPTGAGDVFAVAFSWRFFVTGNAKEAAIYAHAAASLCVEREKMALMPGLEAILKRAGGRG